MILIIYPTSELKKRFLNDKNIIFFNSDKFSFFTKKQREEIHYYNVKYDQIDFSNYDVKEIIKKLKKINPIWSRWVDRLDLHELRLRESVYQIICLSHHLKKLNVKYAIFPTAVAHHLDTAFYEIACSICKIPQVYLYNWFGRLIPTIQLNSIKDRQLINEKISNYNFEYRLNDILEWKKKDAHPKNMFSGIVSRNFYFALLYASFLPIKKILKQFLSKIKIINSFNQSSVGTFPQYSNTIFISQIIQQKKSVNFYIKNTISFTNESNFYDSRPRLLIAAHYQPEATSFPEGGDNDNHIDIVLKIRSLGYGDIIYYKEHNSSNIYTSKIIGFSRVSMYRSVNYYKILKSLGCSFIKSEFSLSLDPKKNKWFVPITITGTIAIERSLAGFHTIIAGEPWYKGLPGTVHINDIDSLKTIDSKYSIQNNVIAKDAYKFLATQLNNKTMINGLGIASGVKVKTANEIKSFLKEYDNLLNILKNEKV